jgi:glutamyl-tRNA synthetase
MYSKTLLDHLTQLLAPEGYQTPSQSAAAFPQRNLPNGAEVMRVAPSPTGFVHIGTVYAALINERVAHQSGGIFILRIEDTDKKREVSGSTEQIITALGSFELAYDEGPELGGAYGPYFQSQRSLLYIGYALELLRAGRAYPCFATPTELQAATKDQQAKKMRPGYYGQHALWRDKTEADIMAALDKNLPFVLRFRSLGSHQSRISYNDVFKGKMEVPENDLDVPLIKSDEYRLPTYHLAHVVDDYLMQATKVFRSDEWLPSTALHIELTQALGFAPFTYGHFAPISVIDKNGGKRKLSKRKDDEADVQYWLAAGYPVEAIKAYLLGLANANFEDWYRAHPNQPVANFPLSLEKLAASRSPLLDMQKLQDYCKDFIAALPQEQFEQRLLTFARQAGWTDFLTVVTKDPAYASAVFAIERSGEKPRKDLAMWSQAMEQYSYFFDDLFTDTYKAAGREAFLSDMSPEIINQSAQAFLATFAIEDDQEVWFKKLKAAASSCGFALDTKAYKAHPEDFKGSLADFARIVRVLLTGKNRTPDLWTICRVMGGVRVQKRLSY